LIGTPFCVASELLAGHLNQIDYRITQPEKSIDTARPSASAFAPSERSEAVTVKPRCASPMARVPNPHGTSRMDKDPGPHRSRMMSVSCPARRSKLSPQFWKIR